MRSYTCPNCGATININPGHPFVSCDFCDSKFTLDRAFAQNLSQLDFIQKMKAQELQEKMLVDRGTTIHKSRRKSWKKFLAVWLVLFILMITFNSIVDSMLVNDMGYSIFLFGLIYILVARPRLNSFINFKTQTKQDEFFHRDQVWRRFFLFWIILLTLCFGIPNNHVLKDAAISLGSLSLIAGCILFPIYRPSKIHD